MHSSIMHLKNEIVHPEKYMHTFYTSEKGAICKIIMILIKKKKLKILYWQRIKKETRWHAILLSKNFQESGHGLQFYKCK